MPETLTQPALADAIRKASSTALAAAGVAIFVPALTLLLLGRETRGWPDWLALLIPAAIWCVGLLAPLGPWRAAIQTLAGVLLLIAPLVITPWGGPGWVMLTTVSFATIVGVVFSFRAGTATILIAVIAGLNAFVARQSPPAVAFPEDDLMGGLMGPLMGVVCGVGLVIAHQAWVRLTRDADRQHAELLFIEESRCREAESSLAQAAVERRIHETVLNTLAGIAMGLTASSARAARDSCIRDLEQLDLHSQPAPGAGVPEIVAAAVSTLAFTELDCQTRIDVEIQLPTAQATALRDALVESLRNVHRHAGTDRVTVMADIEGESIVVRVLDDGSGMGLHAAERYGMRNTLRSGMAAVGGSTTIDAGPNGGTTVTLRLPAQPQTQAIVRHVPVLGLLEDSALSRMGLLGTNVFLLLAAWAIARPLTPSGPVLLAIGFFVAANVALAVAWNTGARVPLALCAIVGAALAFTAGAATAPGCSVVPSIMWLITGVSGGGVLLVMPAFRRFTTRVLIPVAMTSMALALTLSLPSTCRTDPLIMLIVQACYLAAVLYFLQWADATFEGQHAMARAIWQRIVAEESAVAARSAQDDAWSHLSPSALGLLRSIADGVIGADDPAAQVLAATEASALRRRLDMRGGPRDPFDHLLRRLVAAAAGTGSTIDGEALTDMRRNDTLPERVCRMLEDAVGATQQASIVLRAFAEDDEEEYVLTAPSRAIEAAGLADGENSTEDCMATVLPGVDGESSISVRRPGRVSPQPVIRKP